MTPISSQQFESFVPVYDTVPEKWEDARVFLVEQLKKISNAVNIRTIGWLLDEELLSGQAFIPGVTVPGNNPGQFRNVFRIVVDVSPIVMGTNTYPHGIIFDSNFTLIDLRVAATDSSLLKAQVITGDSVIMSAVDLTITSTYGGTYDRAFAFIEYLQEI
jgi:hypothetical protein